MGHSAASDTDPTYYRSPADAISAPPEQLAHVVTFDRSAEKRTVTSGVGGRVHQVRL